MRVSFRQSRLKKDEKIKEKNFRLKVVVCIKISSIIIFFMSIDEISSSSIENIDIDSKEKEKRRRKNEIK